MKTLILCIDRDDDLGTKTGIQAPVIGRKDCLRAAVSLILKDPEESDANSLFGAIKIYDDMVAEGKNVEIAMVVGHVDVGVKSDRVISSQIDQILRKTKPTRTILVSDGADDEFIYPIVSSRTKVDSVQRIIVRQHENIESTFYIIKRYLEHPRIRNKWLVPLSLAFVVGGMFAFAKMVTEGWGAILIVLGLYILITLAKIDQWFNEVTENVRHSLSTGRFNIVFSIIGGFLVVIGGIATYNMIQSDYQWTSWFPAFLLFCMNFIWWPVAGYIAKKFGGAIDHYIREGKSLWTLWMPVLNSIAGAMIIYGFLKLMLTVMSEELILTSSNVTLAGIIIIIGIVLYAIGAGIYGIYIKSYIEREAKSKFDWRY